MKKALLLLIPLMIFISCEDEKEDEEVSAFVGTWDLTFAGEYENSDCTGSLDSTDWAFAQAFGLEQTLTIDNDGTYEMTFSMLGYSESESGIWSENDEGSLSVDGEDFSTTMASDGNSFSMTLQEVAYCEDPYTYEETSHSDSTSCQDAGNDWYEASCLYSEFTKQ
jgi:hypothetical protein